ncbi:MAG: DNA-binding response regulator [Magnetovibrionaceae bacterium]
MSTFMPSAEEVDRQIEDEFLDECRDTMGNLDVLIGNLKSGEIPSTEATEQMRRVVVNLRAQGRGVALPALNTVIEAMADYIGNSGELTDSQFDDLQIFVDRANSVLEGEVDPRSHDACAGLVRTLPQKRKAPPAGKPAAPAATPAAPPVKIDLSAFGDLTQQEVMVLLVLPEKAMVQIVEAELAACGYRSTNARNPFDAFELAIRLKPNMIISSQELGAVTGVDLACAFSAMPPTAQIPFGLLTSYKLGHPSLTNLPPRAALLTKGKSFGDDLAHAFERFNIT